MATSVLLRRAVRSAAMRRTLATTARCARPAHPVHRYFQQKAPQVVVATMVRSNTASRQWKTVAALAVGGVGAVAAFLASHDSLYANEQKTDVRVDPLSGIEHPETLTVATDAYTKYELVGVGMRMVTMFKFYVYSLGFYMQPRDLDRLSSNWQLQPGVEGPFMNELQNPNFTKVLRIAPYRQADFGHIRDGLIKSIEQRLSSASSDSEREQCESDIEKFRSLFPKGSVAVGEQMLLVIQDNVIEVYHQERKLSEMTSPFIAATLPAVYLDANSVSPTAKEDIEAGFARRYGTQ
eukprot:m.358057 g.358057  ORF g.358057 m.358057 type:complete len:294 (+) comp18027_c1_seq1:223-1104(+)